MFNNVNLSSPLGVDWLELILSFIIYFTTPTRKSIAASFFEQKIVKKCQRV